MSSQSKSHPGRACKCWSAVDCGPVYHWPRSRRRRISLLPNGRLYGGYSFFDPTTNVHALLPGGVLPVSSRLESNPRGLGASVTYDFNRWFGLTVDGSTHWGSGETGLAMRIDDTGFSNLSLGPKLLSAATMFLRFSKRWWVTTALTPDAFHDITN